jgi:hypothetical protein
LILREVGVDGGGATVSRAQGRGRRRRDSVNGLRKRMVAARSEARVKVAARSEAGVEAAAHSEAGDEAAVCSGPGIEDGRWWRHDVV